MPSHKSTIANKLVHRGSTHDRFIVRFVVFFFTKIAIKIDHLPKCYVPKIHKRNSQDFYRRIIINICFVRWDLRRSLGMRARFSFVRIWFLEKRQEYRSWVCLSKAHKQPSSTSISWGQCTFYSFIRCSGARARGSLFLNSRKLF